MNEIANDKRFLLQYKMSICKRCQKVETIRNRKLCDKCRAWVRQRLDFKYILKRRVRYKRTKEQDNEKHKRIYKRNRKGVILQARIIRRFGIFMPVNWCKEQLKKYKGDLNEAINKIEQRARTRR